MANEISISATLTQNSNGAVLNAACSTSISLSAATNGSYTNVQAIGNSAEAIAVPADASTSFWLLKNTDSSITVTVGFTNPPTEMKLKPGEFMLFRPADATQPVMYAVAASSSVNLLVCAAGTD